MKRHKLLGDREAALRTIGMGITLPGFTEELGTFAHGLEPANHRPSR
jgi:hypothetical protein